MSARPLRVTGQPCLGGILGGDDNLLAQRPKGFPQGADFGGMIRIQQPPRLVFGLSKPARQFAFRNAGCDESLDQRELGRNIRFDGNEHSTGTAWFRYGSPVLHDAAQGKSQRFARVHKSVFPRRACSDGFWHIGESHDKSAVGVVFQRRVKSVKHRSLLIRTWSSHSVETKLLSDQPHIHWRQIPGLHRRNLSAAFYPIVRALAFILKDFQLDLPGLGKLAQISKKLLAFHVASPAAPIEISHNFVRSTTGHWIKNNMHQEVRNAPRL